MKTIKSIALALFIAAGISASAQTKIDASKSVIKWTGHKVTGKHEGTVKFQDGTLSMKGGKLTDGNFVVNMTTISVTDLTADQGKDKLEGHLKADDFFGADKYPTAKVDFTSVKEKGNGVYAVTANLTIKGKTAPVAFDLKVGKNTATTSFKIDRTKYDIKY
ncbi:MAG: YceI family protein, partial [Chitinophagaceae bacterium]